MATTLAKLLVHVTFSTKNRANLIPAAYESDLYAYLGGVCRAWQSPLLAAGGTADHVHLLVNLSKTASLADLMLNRKRDSSRWFKARSVELDTFAWQEGYFAFSIGASAIEDVRAYIARQKAHHRASGFQDEVRALLAKYGIEYDERYVWA